VDKHGVPGAIVECGVLDGGTAALMAYGSAKSGRPIHLFDSWEGLPDITAQDGDSGAWVGECVGSSRRVLNVMSALKIRSERVHLHKGWFSETLTPSNVHSVGLLHIDADFYESVRLCIEHFYPRLSPGGYIQFDDYGIFAGCTQAIDDFLLTHPELRLQSVGNYAKAYFVQKPSPTQATHRNGRNQ
jgi:O-methyltransferase